MQNRQCPLRFKHSRLQQFPQSVLTNSRQLTHKANKPCFNSPFFLGGYRSKTAYGFFNIFMVMCRLKGQADGMNGVCVLQELMWEEAIRKSRPHSIGYESTLDD